MLKSDKKNASSNSFGRIQDEDSVGLLSDASLSHSYQSYFRYSRAQHIQQFYGNTESHQYEPDESEVWRHHQLLRYTYLSE